MINSAHLWSTMGRFSWRPTMDGWIFTVCPDSFWDDIATTVEGRTAIHGQSTCRRRNASMRVLVTGSASHLGQALVRTLKDLQHEVVGLDILESPFTTHVGSIAERSYGVDATVSVLGERLATCCASSTTVQKPVTKVADLRVAPLARGE